LAHQLSWTFPREHVTSVSYRPHLTPVDG
jgi:hypothetical protein